MALNLAPMVDVMMCLIIFFLLASKLVSAEQYPVHLPYAVAAKEVDAGDLGSRITIGVRRSEQDENVAEYVVVDWDGQNIRERVLPPGQLDALIAARARRAAGGGVRPCCVIRADKEVTYEHVEAVLRACGLAKISDIVFAAKSGVDPAGGGP
jgi:biopolymer transport protein ExbD